MNQIYSIQIQPYISSCPFLTINSCTRSLQSVSSQHCSLAVFEFCPLAWGLMHVGCNFFTQAMKSVSPWMAYHPACTAKCRMWQTRHIQNQPLARQPAATILEALLVVITGCIRSLSMPSVSAHMQNHISEIDS